MATLFARQTAEKPLICEGCGCTDDNACPGGCHWVSRKPPVCSACTNAAGEFAVGSPDGSMFGEEYCPASETPARHVPLFTTATDWHCVRCRQEFFA